MDEKKIKEKSLNLSIKENIYANLAVGFGDYYISPYAIALKIPTVSLGLLTSLPNIFGPILQILGNYLTKFYTRKNIFILSILLQSIIYLFIALNAYFYFIGYEFTPYILIFLFMLYVGFGNLGTPAWISWIGDLVDKEKLGKFFSFRNATGVFFNIISIILAGLILDFFKIQGDHKLFLGFFLIFILAFVFHFLRIKKISEQYEPNFILKQEDYFTFFQFIKRLPKTNFGRFVIINALIIFALNLSGPYYNLFLFRYLKFSYTEYLILQVVLALSSFFIFPLWGKLGDKFGHLSVLRLNSILISLNPLLWYFTIYLNQSFIFSYLIFVYIISGISLSGFGLSGSNFFYSVVSNQKRGLCYAYSSIINGLAIILGSILGGYLIELFSNPYVNSIMIVSIISALLRFIFGSMFMIFVREPKTLEKYLFEAFKEKFVKIEQVILFEAKSFTNEILTLPKLIKKFIIKRR